MEFYADEYDLLGMAKVELTTAQIEPCPFCGSINVELQNANRISYWLECQSCGTRQPPQACSGGQESHLAAVSAAVAMWNKRHPPGCPPVDDL